MLKREVEEEEEDEKVINVNNVICGWRGTRFADVCRGGCYFSGNVH